MAVDDSGDVSAEVHIEVTGISSLQEGAEAAEELSDAIDEVAGSSEAASGAVGELAGELDELGDAGPGIEEDAAAIGHLRDNALEADPAIASLAAQMDALGDSGSGAASLWSTLKEIRDVMADMDRGEEMSIYRGGSGGFGIVPPSEQLEDELGNMYESATAAPGAAVIDQQMEDLEREMGTFETSAAKYLHTVQDIKSGMSDASVSAGEAAAALGTGGLGGSLDDASISMEDAWTAVSQLEGALFLGENAAATFTEGMDGGVVSLGVLAGAMEDTEGAVGDLEGALGGGSGGAGGMTSALGALSDGWSTLGGVIKGIPGIPGWLTTGAKWTGIATLIGGAVSVLDPLVAGTVAFGALGAPALYKVYEGWESVSQAQKTYQQAQAVAKRDPTKDNLADEATDLAKLQAAYAAVPKDVRPAIAAIHQLGSAYEEASKKSGIQMDALGDIPKVIHDITGALPALSSLGQSFAPELSHMFGDISRWEGSPAFESFITNLDKDMPPAATAVRKLADAIGGIVSSLATPANVKSFSGMFTGLASGLKAVTPGAVHELSQVAVEIGKIGGEVKTLQGGSAAPVLGRWFDDLMDVPSALFRGVGAEQKAAVGFTEYLAQAAGKTGPQQKHLWDSLFGGGSATAGQDGKKAGAAYSDGVKSGVKDANLSNLLDPGSGKADNLLAAGRAAGAQYADGLRQAVRDVNLSSLLKAPDASAVKNLMGSGKLKVPAEVDPSTLQSSVDTAAKNVKIHGVTVDLSNAKLSGLSALASTVGKAGQAAGKDYDVALGSAIAAQSGNVVGKARAIESEIRSSMSGMAAAGQSAGDALGEGLAAGIEASTGPAVAAATAMANAVTAAVRTAHQTASPSKVFKQIGRDDVLGLIMGLEEGKDTLAQVIKDLDPTKALKHLITTAEHYARSLVTAAESGSSLSTLYGETQAGVKSAGAAPPVYATMGGAMKASLKQLKAFDWNIKELKKEGLSKKLLDELIKEGPSALPEARSILKGGKHGIDRLDDLEKQIEKWSDKLGRTGTDIKYGRKIGQDVAAGMAPQIGRVVSAIKDQKAQTANISLTVKLDGKTLARQVQTATLQRAGRNISSGLKLPNRGA